MMSYEYPDKTFIVEEEAGDAVASIVKRNHRDKAEVEVVSGGDVVARFELDADSLKALSEALNQAAMQLSEN